MRSIHATLLGLPEPVITQLEQAFQGEGFTLECRRLAPDKASLPAVLPPGLVLLWDDEGPVEQAAGLCARLASLCALSLCRLVVLSCRDAAGRAELIRTGASECLHVPAEEWTTDLLAHVRQRGVPSREGALTPPSGLSRVPPAQALETLLAATTAELGHDFFRTLVRQIAEAFRITCAMVGELTAERNSIRTLAFWSRGSSQDTMTYPLSGTPCLKAHACSSCQCAEDVSQRFPQNEMLTDLGLRGYLGMALRNPRGEVIGVLAIMHDRPLDTGELDLTLLGAFAARAGAELERLRAQAELERLQARAERERTQDFLRHTLEAMPEPIFVEDRDHRVLAVNNALCRLVGRPERELVGQSGVDVMPESQTPSSWEREERSLAPGPPRAREQSFIDGSGLTRTLRTRQAVLPGPDGHPTRVSVIQDLTELRRLEAQLRLANRMSSMGTLAAGVAHEINNPLSYVTANVAYLSEQLSESTVSPELLPELREVLAETREGAQRIRDIVQDLKSFTRGDEERLGAMELHPVLEGAGRWVRNELQRYNACLEYGLEPVPRVRGNASRLGQVLVNLLVNAMQAFSEQRPGHNRIRVSSRLEAPGRVVVAVEDNGQGMSPEVLERIFTPFFTTKPVGVGTGLGLTICQSIIESMGGWIDVRSTPGLGTTFEVNLCVADEVDKAKDERGPVLLSETSTLRCQEAIPVEGADRYAGSEFFKSG